MYEVTSSHFFYLSVKGCYLNMYPLLISDCLDVYSPVRLGYIGKLKNLILRLQNCFHPCLDTYSLI